MVNSLVRILAAIDRGIALAERAALAIGVLGMTLVSVANVIMRNVFDASLAFADEINQSLIIVVTFLGVGFAARLGRHIRMTAIYDQLGQAGRKTLMVVMSLTTALLLFTLAWYALRYVLHAQEINAVTAALQIPLYLIYAVVPLGLALGGIQYLLGTVRNLTSRDVWLSFTERDRYEEADVESATKRI